MCSLAALLILEDFFDASAPCPLLLAFLLKRERKREINVVVNDYGSHQTNKKVQHPVVIKSCNGNSFKH